MDSNRNVIIILALVIVILAIVAGILFFQSAAKEGSALAIENENVTVYVSSVDRSSGEPKLLGVDDDEEWNRVKDVLRELSKAE